MAAPKLEVISSTSSGSKPVYDAVQRFALEGLSDLIRVLMESVDDALFELSDKVDNDRERSMYFEAMREIRLKREGIKQNFDFEMHRCFDGFINGKSVERVQDDEEELTLVELDDLEDSIAIENMISKARPHFEDDLFAVTERLKIVLRLDEIDEDQNPFDPKAICDSFHNASELLDTDIQVKLIFYKLFDRYVMNNLGHFYRELNQLFIEKGVLPGFKPDQERMKQTTRFMANRIKNSVSQMPGTMPIDMGAGAAQNAMVGTNPTADGNVFASLQQALVPGHMATPYAGGTAQPGVAGGAIAPTGGVAAPAGGFVAALTNLQTTSIPTQPVTSIDPQSLKADMQQQLITFKQENQDQVNAGDSQIIDVVSMLFDFFFDDEALPAPIKVLIGRLQIPILKVAIIDKDFFNHKKHPARKLLDSISRASLGWGDNHENEKALIEKTEKIIDFLLNEFDEDIAAFEYALAEFEQFVNQEEAQIEQANEALIKHEQEKDLRFQQAQDAAAELVIKLTKNRELSYEVIDFLETIWSSVLFATFLSLGESSNHWKNLKRISTTFVWTLIPKFSEPERVKIIQTIPALLRALSKGMELVKINNDVQNRIFRMLAQEHAKIVKQTSKNIVTRIDDKTVWPEDQTGDTPINARKVDTKTSSEFKFDPNDTGEIEVTEIEAEDDSITHISAATTRDVIEDLNQFTTGVKQGKIQVDEEIVLGGDDAEDFDLLVDKQGDDSLKKAKQLEIGTWVEFKESESKTLVARLSWKSNVTGNFVFVNRQGHKVRNLTINAFAVELRSGRVKMIESSSVFDRAIYTIMSKVKH